MVEKNLSNDIADSTKTAYERWELPNVSDDALKNVPKLPTAEEIEQVETAAYNEGLKSGFDEGYKNGLEKGQIEIKERCDDLNKVLNFLQRPLDDLDEKVTEQLFQLAMTVTGQLIRRELHTDPGQIIAVVREAMTSLPIAERKVNIHLHPEDATLVRNALSLNHDNESQPWHIIEDPLLSRGGCKLQAGQSYIDASVETRLNRIIATLLGGERNSDLNIYSDAADDEQPAVLEEEGLMSESSIQNMIDTNITNAADENISEKSRDAKKSDDEI